MPHSERAIPVYCLAAWGSWAFVAVCIIAGAIVGLGLGYFRVMVTLYAFGLVGSAVAATVSLRNVVAHRDQLLRDAFEIGREVTPDGVRRLR